MDKRVTRSMKNNSETFWILKDRYEAGYERLKVIRQDLRHSDFCTWIKLMEEKMHLCDMMAASLEELHPLEEWLLARGYEKRELGFINWINPMFLDMSIVTRTSNWKRLNPAAAADADAE